MLIRENFTEEFPDAQTTLREKGLFCYFGAGVADIHSTSLFLNFQSFLMLCL